MAEFRDKRSFLIRTLDDLTANNRGEMRTRFNRTQSHRAGPDGARRDLQRKNQTKLAKELRGCVRCIWTYAGLIMPIMAYSPWGVAAVLFVVLWCCGDVLWLPS